MIHEIQAKTILSRNKYPNYWFGVHFNMNIYRGCSHGCIYCDSRSPCYRVKNFDRDIHIKENAIELLQKELPRRRRNETLGFGAMSDPYIPIEKTYKMTQQALALISKYHLPLFLLTKSNLILRDIEYLEAINKHNYLCVAFTITTTDDVLAKQIEPHAPLPSERFKAMGVLASVGIKVGVVVTPTLPFITDSLENLESIIKQAAQQGGSFVYAGFGVTLRDEQRAYYYDHISEELVEKYKRRYGNRYMCISPNYQKLKSMHKVWCKQYGVSHEMPSIYIENRVQLQQLF